MTTIKTMLLFAGLMMLGLVGNGQEKQYIPLVEPGKVWFEVYPNSGWPPSPYGYAFCGRKYLLGDTIIGDKQYMKIYHEKLDIWCTDIILEGPEYVGAIRDEIEEQKVWYVHPDDPDYEFLFFDFSLGAGDSIPPFCYFNLSFFPFEITDVDTIITPDGVARRRWIFDDDPWCDESYVIEGIGNSSGFLAHYQVYFEGGSYLICMHTDTVLNFCHEYYPGCQIPTDSCGTLGIRSSEKKSVLKIFPNPSLASNPVRISGIPATADAPAIIEVFDLTGRRLISAATKQTDFIFNSPEKQGVYFGIVSNSMFKQTLKMVVK